MKPIPLTIISLALLAHCGASRADLITWTGDWVQEAIWAPTAPAFGARSQAGTFTEDHRFGESAAASGVITDTDAMPGVFRTLATATSQSVVSPSAVDSQVRVFVQFSRSFRLSARAAVTVIGELDGVLTVEDTNGQAEVKRNAGIATLAGAKLLSIVDHESISIDFGTKETRAVSVFDVAGVLLKPGDYKIWGGLSSFARINSDILGGDQAKSEFLSSYRVSVTAGALRTPEPSSLALVAAGSVGLLAMLRRKRSRRQSA